MPKPRDYTVPRCCRPTDALLFLIWTNVMEVYVPTRICNAQAAAEEEPKAAAALA